MPRRIPIDFRSERGAVAGEYAVLLGILTIALVTVLGLFTGALVTLFNSAIGVLSPSP